MLAPETLESYVVVARVLRPRGNRGEVLAEDFSDDPGRFVPSATFRLSSPVGQRETIELERVWHHKGRLVLKFRGVDSISEAETLRGLDLLIPRSELGPPPEGAYYLQDLIGCQVVETGSGRSLGKVEDVLEPGGPLVLQVFSGKRELLIPFVRDICVDVRIEEKQIRVRMPEGLEELNP